GLQNRRVGKLPKQRHPKLAAEFLLGRRPRYSRTHLCRCSCQFTRVVAYLHLLANPKGRCYFQSDTLLAGVKVLFGQQIRSHTIFAITPSAALLAAILVAWDASAADIGRPRLLSGTGQPLPAEVPVSEL